MAEGESRMDHRQGTRHPVNWPVVLRIGNRRHGGTIMDVSMTGAYIRTTARVVPPAFVGVKLRSRGSSAWSSQEPMLVVRVDAFGFAVEWNEELSLGAMMPQEPIGTADSLTGAARMRPEPRRAADARALRWPPPAETTERKDADARRRHGA